MHVAALHIYPVKGARGISLATVALLPMGLAHDRQWMIVDQTGTFLTQRDTPQLAQLDVAVADTGALTVSVAHEFTVDVAVPVDGSIPVTVWKNTLIAIPADRTVSQHLSRWLGKPVTLVCFPGAGARLSNPVWAGADVPVGFADAYPVLVACSASLEDLNARMKTPVPMTRFRANIVIEGASPWADDGWQRIKIGAAELDLVKPCDRCIVTTTDQQTGARLGPEPLATLATFRRSAVAGVGGVLFGTNAVPRSMAQVSVGDTVTVLQTRSPWSLVGASVTES